MTCVSRKLWMCWIAAFEHLLCSISLKFVRDAHSLSMASFELLLGVLSVLRGHFQARSTVAVGLGHATARASY